MLEGDDPVCVAAVSAGKLVSSTLQPGTRVPAWCTANGRVMLASLPQTEVDAYLERVAIEPLTEYTIVNRERLLLEIVRTRSQGYAVVDQELELGLRTLSVPIRSFRGDTVAAMNVSLHAARIPATEIVERCLPALLKVQVEMAALL